ncbi:hypothetical protein CAEBREN_09615 [Caenorhabditis brenneri]|uniref:Uncharacterized protein n=1 Tax=Caenorhabditis brenneri TaxID=135651 RepID=G0NF65_CAEBE|nr:hypothetical protein CAEBREN_09615 [Caenorhabditis brenneri]
MFKSFIIFSALALAAFCAPPGWSNAEKKQEFLAAGISSQAADGILKIAKNFGAEKPTGCAETNTEAERTAFHQFISETDAYIKTQSPDDEAAYNALMEKKKADFNSRLAAGEVVK